VPIGRIFNLMCRVPSSESCVLDSELGGGIILEGFFLVDERFNASKPWLRLDIIVENSTLILTLQGKRYLQVLFVFSRALFCWQTRQTHRTLM
jgi:hypothetical protein